MATTTTVTTADTVKAAYDRAVYKALRPHLHYVQCATVKPTMQDKPGSSVTFDIKDDLAVASTPLDESTDVDPQTLSSDQVTVTLAEYGNAAEVTEKILGLTYDVPAFDEEAAERIGYNAAISMDTVARNALIDNATNIVWATGGATTPAADGEVQVDDVATAHDIRVAVAELYTANVVPWRNTFFKGLFSPAVILDIREESGAGAWRVPKEYGGDMGGEIAVGAVGEFEGVEFIQTPRAEPEANGGSGNVDLYKSAILGRQALAKAWSRAVSGEHPQVRIRPPVDRLLRFHSVGWYQLAGYGIFRQDSTRIIKSSASTGANA